MNLFQSSKSSTAKTKKKNAPVKRSRAPVKKAGLPVKKAGLPKRAKMETSGESDGSSEADVKVPPHGPSEGPLVSLWGSSEDL